MKFWTKFGIARSAAGLNHPPSSVVSTAHDADEERKDAQTSNIFLNCALTLGLKNAATPELVPMGQSRMALMGKPTKSLFAWNAGASPMIRLNKFNINM